LIKLIEEAIGADSKARIVHLKTMHLGREELLVAAKVTIAHSESGREIAEQIDAAEQPIREAVPNARVIYLEPDIFRADRTSAAWESTGA